jgi:site-specific DNA-methyltransferase (adenine-specific)
VTIVSPDVSARTFDLVPIQDFSRPWTDDDLYKKYGLEDDEITFIESNIKSMK